MRILVILAACCIVGSPAFAEPAAEPAGPTIELFSKLYATLDVYGDLASAGSHHTLSLRSGGMAPTYFGMSGGAKFSEQESLTLYVESLFDLVQLDWLKQGIGDRRASAVLRSRWGNLSVGRQFTPHLWFMGGEMDAFALGFTGTPYSLLAAGVDLMLRTRSIMYESPRLAGFSGEVMVSRDAHNDDTGRAIGGNDVHVKLDFRGSGFYGGVVYVDQQRFGASERPALDVSSASDPRTSIPSPSTVFEHRQVIAAGGSYDQSLVGGTLGAQRVIGRHGAPSFVEIVAGFKLHTGPHQLLGSWAWSRSDDGREGGEVYGIAHSYALTPRFAVYSSIAWIRNRAESQFNLGTPINLGEPATDVIAGLRLRL